MAAGQNWTREETLAAFALYHALPAKYRHKGNENVIALAKAIGRTPASVELMLTEIDDSAPRLIRWPFRGRKHPDYPIWDEYKKRGQDLLIESQTVLEDYLHSRLTASQERVAQGQRATGAQASSSRTYANKAGMATVSSPIGKTSHSWASATNRSSTTETEQWSPTGEEIGRILDVPFDKTKMDYALRRALVLAGFSTLGEVFDAPRDRLVEAIGYKGAKQISAMKLAYEKYSSSCTISATPDSGSSQIAPTGNASTPVPTKDGSKETTPPITHTQTPPPHPQQTPAAWEKDDEEILTISSRVTSGERPKQTARSDREILEAFLKEDNQRPIAIPVTEASTSDNTAIEQASTHPDTAQIGISETPSEPQEVATNPAETTKEEEALANEALDQELQSVGIGKGTLAILERFGIYTIDDFLRYHPQELLELSGITSRTIKFVSSRIQTKTGIAIELDEQDCEPPIARRLTSGEVEIFDTDVDALDVSGLVKRQLRRSSLTKCKNVLQASIDELLDCPGIDLDTTLELEAALGKLIGYRVILGCERGEPPRVATGEQPLPWRNAEGNSAVRNRAAGEGAADSSEAPTITEPDSNQTATTDTSEPIEETLEASDVPQAISILKWLDSVTDVYAQVIIEYLAGKNDSDVARATNVPRSVAPMLLSYGLKRRPELYEDQFIPYVLSAKPTEQEFCATTNEPVETYRYLYLLGKCGLLADYEGPAVYSPPTQQAVDSGSTPDAKPSSDTPKTSSATATKVPNSHTVASAPRRKYEGSQNITASAQNPRSAHEWMQTLTPSAKRIVRSILSGASIDTTARRASLTIDETRAALIESFSKCPSVREDQFMPQFERYNSPYVFSRKTHEPEATYYFLYWRNQANSQTSGAGQETPSKPTTNAVSRAPKDAKREGEHAPAEPIPRPRVQAATPSPKPSAPTREMAAQRLAADINRIAVWGREYSTDYFFGKLPRTMSRLGINSVDELYDLVLEAFAKDREVAVLPGRIIQFGQCNRNRQLRTLYREISPCYLDDYLVEYRTRFGVAPTVTKRWLDELGVDWFDQAGRPRGTSPTRSSSAPSRMNSEAYDAQLEYLRSALTSDCCDRKLIEERFKARFPEGPSNPFDLATLVALGYSARGDKLLFKNGVNPEIYFSDLINSHTLFARGDKGFEDAIYGDRLFTSILRRKWRSYEILEYEKDAFVKTEHLCKQMGVTEETIRSYAQDITSRIGKGVPFTIWSLRHRYGIHHPLDVLKTEGGMSDFIYESLLDVDQSIKYCTLSNTRVFMAVEGSFTATNFIECIIELNGYMEIDDLADHLKDAYGIDCQVSNLLRIIGNSSLYYDDITDSVYNSRREWEKVISDELA